MIFWLMMGVLSSVWAGEKERVADIRKWYEAVQEGKPKSEKKVKFEAANEPLAGEVTYREYADGLKAITISYSAGDHGGAEEHYYYRKGELFFAFLEQGSWRFDGQDSKGESSTRDTLVEQRLYLEEGKCFRLLRRVVSGSDPEKLKALMKETPHKKEEPDDETAAIFRRGLALLETKTDAEVLKVFDADLVPAE